MFDLLDPAQLLIFLVVALAAEIIGTMAGFGITTILLPVATLFMGVKEAVVVVGLFHFVGEIVDGFIWRKFINWRVGILFSILGILFAFVGALLVAYVQPRAIEIVLGAFLVLYALYSLSGKELKLPRGDGTLVVAGGVSGFLAGILGTAGALRTAALTTLRLKKEEFLGTAFAIAFLVDLTRVSVYVSTGLLELSLVLLTFVVLTAIAGSLVGRAFVNRISSKVFYRIIYTALFIAGLKFLLL